MSIVKTKILFISGNASVLIIGDKIMDIISPTPIFAMLGVPVGKKVGTVKSKDVSLINIIKKAMNIKISTNVIPPKLLY